MFSATLSQIRTSLANGALVVVTFAVVSCGGGSGGGGSGGGGDGTTTTSTSPSPSVVTAPSLSAPSQSPFHSNDDNLTISGSCTSGNTVNLTGDDTQSVACSSSAFSFTVSKTVDDIYSFSLAATDGATTSSSVSLQWIRDTAAPGNVTVTSPGASPYTSDTNFVTIQGACESGATVTIRDVAASGSSTVSCSSGAYSYTSGSKSSDATYDFQIKQTDRAGNPSGTLTWQWVRNTSSVSVPVIASPSSSPHYSNANSLVLSGSCTDGNTINLSGDATDSVVCASTAFSFTINKASDGTYNFSLMASNGSTDSNSATFQWIRDTVVPSDPTVDAPGASPYTSGDDSITISGACESGATVNVSDVAATTSTDVSCSSGSYSYTSATKTLDGDYDFNIKQTDKAGNASGTVTWRWSRNTTIPSTPGITSPASSPHYSNSSPLTISGTCTPDFTVVLSGDAAQTATCSNPGGTYSFSVSVNLEGSYSFSIVQHDGLGGPNSSANTLTWVYDTTVPAAPTISGPVAVASGGSGTYTSAGDITVSGSCENGATVTLSNGDSQTATCSSSSYSFNVIASCGATKILDLSQTDRAGNPSGATRLTWSKDCTLMAEPTIVSPSRSPHAASSTSLTISGGCDTGMTIVLGGEVLASEVSSPSGSLQTTCADSSYSFTIDKSADAQPAIRYDLTLKQQDSATAPTKISNEVPLVWIRNGANQTAALYHFDTATGVAFDSSLYGNSSLSDNATASVAGRYAEARDFISASSSYMAALGNDAQRTARHFMTFETWLQLDTVPGNNGSFVFAEREGVWKLQLTRQGGSTKYYFEFVAHEELGGSCGAAVSVKSSTMSLVTPQTAFTKLAVTFELGSVTIYYNNTIVGTGTVGLAGNAELCDTGTGSLVIGSDSGTGSFLDGKLDELSISQKIRDPGRTGPFTAD